MKFLGMEAMKKKGKKGYDEWHISQRSYLTDLLGEERGLKSKKIPITKDQAVMPKDTGVAPPEAIREAQKTVGELLWVVTRTRPDLMYCVCSAPPQRSKKLEHKARAISGTPGIKGSAIRKKMKKNG